MPPWPSHHGQPSGVRLLVVDIMPGGARNWARALTGGSFVIGLGYLLMKSACCPAHGDADLIATVPTEEQLYKVGKRGTAPCADRAGTAAGSEEAGGCSSPCTRGGRTDKLG